MMHSLIKRLQANRVFKFASSVRLAVPLMLIIAGVIAAGTLYESAYNAQVAKIKIYQTIWFQGLMALLWINIFCATLSRLPFKKHHTGFVITHIGLLTLLIGAQLTSQLGIDGQLRVIEGQSSNQVFLSDLVLKIATPGGPAIQTIHINRFLDEKTGSDLGLDHVRELIGLNVDNYLPFVSVEQKLVPGDPNAPGSGMAVSFNLKNQFFNVNQTLDSVNQPDMQMGPAHIRIVVDPVKSGESSSSARQKEVNRAVASAKSGSVLVVRDAQSGKTLRQIPVSSLKENSVTVNGTRISLIKVYEQAVVAANKLVEQGTPGANPALELKVERQGQVLREVCYEKFPEFSLNAKGDFGLRFQYQSGGSEAAAAGGSAEQDIPMHGKDSAGAEAPSQSMSGAGPGAGNVIEFHVSKADSGSVRVILFKNGKKEFSQTAKQGETVRTPWMGIQITIQSIGSAGSMEEVIKPTEMQPKMPLPPSALFIRSDVPGSEGFWLTEGDARTVQTTRGNFEVYYGPDSVTLPFDVKLDQFQKVDYPGTETAMSFESRIRLNGGGEPIRIVMNEPLQHEGYLLYQSSYEMGQGAPTASIFSVNHDPGRWLKYIGAIILVIGIVVFTIMRSKWYVNYSRSRVMKNSTALLSFLLVLFCSSVHADAPGVFTDLTPEAATQNIVSFSKQIDISEIRALPVQSNGRVKPLDSFARETVLFLSGKYSMWGVDAVQLLLGLSVSNASAYVPILNIRDPDLRVTLGFPKSHRYFTLQELSGSPIERIAAPIVEKREKNEKLLTPDDKKVVEVVQQIGLLRQILTGSYIMQSMLLDVGKDGTPHGDGGALVMEKAQRYVEALRNSDFPGAKLAAMELVPIAKTQSMPALFQASISKLNMEVFYNHARPFFWVAIVYMLLGFALVSGMLTQKLTPRLVLGILIVPMLVHAAGFGMRVYITGFAPVTSMYGTMVWMAFGVVLFGSILFAIYKNSLVYGILLIGASTTLLLTESIPLILSPEMDPIVAVLRNNFWLTIHVLTISISYAALTIAMLIGNAGLIQTIFKRDTPEGLKSLAHLSYRAIQLGVFLLTTGIILGGWWADYSWGRFWGWDPKETWALIADLGFISILHARYVGWLDGFGLLAASPIAYLLVIMAWYGVNFILAAGLHSYGFSSGGATIVEIFVGAQMVLFAAGIVARKAHAARA